MITSLRTANSIPRFWSAPIFPCFLTHICFYTYQFFSFSWNFFVLFCFFCRSCPLFTFACSSFPLQSPRRYFETDFRVGFFRRMRLRYTEKAMNWLHSLDLYHNPALAPDAQIGRRASSLCSFCHSFFFK